MSILTKEGLGALKFAYVVLAAGVGVAAFLVVGGYLYWQSEKKNNAQSIRTMSDTQSRLANAKRERDDLRNSEDTYNALTARGLFIAEKRLDLLEALEALKVRHNIASLEFDLGPQRPLKLAGGSSISAVEARGSRLRLRAKALHDGEMLAFLNDFSRMQRGLFPMDRCVIRRDTQNATAAQALLTGSRPAAAAGADATPPAPDTAATAPSGTSTLAPLIEAECTLEWITLVDLRAQAATPATAASAAPSSTPPGAGK
jgi:hypothetical protein